MNTTNKMALAAASKAREMGWEVRVELDQSDVLDWATVAAWAPGARRGRVIRFIEGEESFRCWKGLLRIEDFLGRADAYPEYQA